MADMERTLVWSRGGISVKDSRVKHTVEHSQAEQ
jgi:hypothetical protein